MDTNSEKRAIRKVKKRNFQYSWLDEVIFRGWLAPHPTEDKAFCKFCNIAIRCCRTDLVRHSQRVKHIKLTRNQSLDDNNNNIIDKHSDKVIRAEIKLAAFFMEHNIAFYAADHLIPLLKDVCIDSKIVHDLSLARSKCAIIVKEVIAKREVEKLIEILQTRRFSILLDETTDISNLKVMCVLVQFLSSDKKLRLNY